MKTQINNWRRLTIAFTVLTFLAVLNACKEKKESSPDTAKSTEAVKQPEVDIQTAVITEDTASIKQYVAAGAGLNAKDPIGGSSPLISACLFGKTEIARMLIDAGADLNLQNNEGSTALHTAAFFCYPEIVKMLLQKGADKTVKNNYGKTAYESVEGSFADVKPIYESLGKVLEPMGLKLDYTQLEKTRPVIAALLK
ncbi:MAG: ankyrin repeat domain-containing protein [Chitinophagaceae bacterium]|nr:ankyrin repeat domain-containing protein [Chitinophagaceae bacterium]